MTTFRLSSLAVQTALRASRRCDVLLARLSFSTHRTLAPPRLSVVSCFDPVATTAVSHYTPEADHRARLPPIICDPTRRQLRPLAAPPKRRPRCSIPGGVGSRPRCLPGTSDRTGRCLRPSGGGAQRSPAVLVFAGGGPRSMETPRTPGRPRCARVGTRSRRPRGWGWRLAQRPLEPVAWPRSDPCRAERADRDR
jgi:hypothetical protein